MELISPGVSVRTGIESFSPQCRHDRVMHVMAKADDRQCYRVPHLDIDKDGYAPRIEGLCHGDYVEFTVCLDCGTVTSMRSEGPPLVSDDELYEAFGIDPPIWEGGDENEHLRSEWQ